MLLYKFNWSPKVWSACEPPPCEFHHIPLSHCQLNWLTKDNTKKYGALSPHYWDLTVKSTRSIELKLTWFGREALLDGLWMRFIYDQIYHYVWFYTLIPSIILVKYKIWLLWLNLFALLGWYIIITSHNWVYWAMWSHSTIFLIIVSKIFKYLSSMIGNLISFYECVTTLLRDNIIPV